MDKVEFLDDFHLAEVYGLMIFLLDELLCSKEVCGLPDVVDKQQEDGFEAKGW